MGTVKPSRRWISLGAPFRRFHRAENGSVLVEFALIAPAFFLLVFVIIETALIFVAEQVLHNAVATAAREVRIGQVQSDGLSDSGFRDEICANLTALIDCDSGNFYLDVRAYETFASADVSDPIKDDGSFSSSGAYEFGGPSDIVVVRAYYQWPTNPIYGRLAFANLANGKRLIGSFAAFRNEPFPEIEEESEATASAPLSSPLRGPA